MWPLEKMETRYLLTQGRDGNNNTVKIEYDPATEIRTRRFLIPGRWGKRDFPCDPGGEMEVGWSGEAHQ